MADFFARIAAAAVQPLSPVRPLLPTPYEPALDEHAALAAASAPLLDEVVLEVEPALPRGPRVPETARQAPPQPRLRFDPRAAAEPLSTGAVRPQRAAVPEADPAAGLSTVPLPLPEGSAAAPGAAPRLSLPLPLERTPAASPVPVRSSEPRPDAAVEQSGLAALPLERTPRPLQLELPLDALLPTRERTGEGGRTRRAEADGAAGTEPHPASRLPAAPLLPASTATLAAAADPIAPPLAAAPTIQVHIGRVELRAEVPVPPAAQRPRPAPRSEPPLSDYLAQRRLR